MFEGWIDELIFYVDVGGFVMPPLLFGLLVLWFALGYRFATLKRGNPRSVRRLVTLYSEGYNRKPRGLIDGAVVTAIEIAKTRKSEHILPCIEDAFFDYKREFNRFAILIKSIVTAAPLAGLLGTVTGMIETFNSLGDMSLFAQSGGIAGGISQALFTTQLGLAVAIPGLVVGRILDRKQHLIERELDRIKALVCGGEPHGEAV